MSPPDRAEEFVFVLVRHERSLGAYVMTMAPHAQGGDDILLEAKVVMWRSFAKFEPGTNFGGFAGNRHPALATPALRLTLAP